MERDDFLRRLESVVTSPGRDGVDQRRMAAAVEVLVRSVAAHVSKSDEIRLPWSVPERVLAALRKPPGDEDIAEWRATTSLLLALAQEGGLLAVKAPPRHRRFLSLDLNIVRPDWWRADALARVREFALRCPSGSDDVIHRHYVISACLLTMTESHLTIPAFFDAVACAREIDLSLQDGILTLAVHRHKKAPRDAQQEPNRNGWYRNTVVEVREGHRERFHLGPLSRAAWGRLMLYYLRFPQIRDDARLLEKPFDDPALLKAACDEAINAVDLGPPRTFTRLVRADGLLWRPPISVVYRAGKLNVAPAPGPDLAWTGWTLKDGLVVSQAAVPEGEPYRQEPRTARPSLAEKHDEIRGILRSLNQQTSKPERLAMADRLERLAGPPDTPLTALPNSLVLARFAASLLRNLRYRSATVNTWLEGLWELIPAVLEDTHLTDLTTADDLLEFVETCLCTENKAESKKAMKKRIKALLRFLRDSGCALPPVNWRDPLLFVEGDRKVLRLPSLREIRTTVETFLASERPDGLALAVAVILCAFGGLRRGEVVRLRRTDVRGDRWGTIRIPHSKTASGRRQVLLFLLAPTWAIEVVQRYEHEWAASIALEAPWLLTPDRTAWDPEELSDRVQRTLVRVAGPGTSIHSLRRACGSWLAVRLVVATTSQAPPVDDPCFESEAAARLLQVLSADPVIAARSLCGLLGHLSPDVTVQHYLGTFEYLDAALSMLRDQPIDRYDDAADLLQVTPGHARSLLARAKPPLPLSGILALQIRRMGGTAPRV